MTTPRMHACSKYCFRRRAMRRPSSSMAAANLQQQDVVLLDLALPGMSGIEVAAELRRDPERWRGVLVAITAHGPESVPSPSPFDRYFGKPLDFAAMLAYLSELSAR